MKFRMLSLRSIILVLTIKSLEISAKGYHELSILARAIPPSPYIPSIVPFENISELDSIIKGEEPNSISDLKKIKRLNEYPTLGSPEERFQWRNSLNIITSELAFKNNYKFLDINPYIYKDSHPNKVQFDGIHISNPDVIIDINKNVLDFFK